MLKRLPVYQGKCSECGRFIIIPLSYQGKWSPLYGCTTWGSTKTVVRQAFVHHVKQYHKAPKLKIMKKPFLFNAIKS
jgi:hypothetical protein